MQSTSPAFEESILILLAMFKILFPAGNQNFQCVPTLMYHLQKVAALTTAVMDVDTVVEVTYTII